MGGDGRRSRVEPTDEWEQIELLCRWPEQVAYEEIRTLTLFGSFVAERARQTVAKAEDWAELALAHERFVEDCNAQGHWAHRDREDGRRSPAGVLGFVFGVRHREEELGHAFFSSRFVRVLDSLGYARFRHWRLYGEEALAGREAALWMAAESLTLEHDGEPLSRYEVRIEPDTGRLRSVGRPRLFETPRSTPQPRIFALNALGEGGWLKAMRLARYAPRSPRRPKGLQQTLFAYHEAWE